MTLEELYQGYNLEEDYIGKVTQVYRSNCTAQIDNLSLMADRSKFNNSYLPNSINFYVIIDSVLGLFLGEVFENKASRKNVFDTAGGVLFAKFLNLFSKKKINPMIGAAGISAFPMSARVVHKLGLEEDNQNFLLMHSIGVNVSGQIASVIAGGMILSLMMK